jgi:hypothetical protein
MDPVDPDSDPDPQHWSDEYLRPRKTQEAEFFFFLADLGRENELKI